MDLENRIVEIHLCKECDNAEGYQLNDHPSLAECTSCQHLCDVDGVIENEIKIIT